MTRDQAKDLSPTELLHEASRRIKEKDDQEAAVKAGEARVDERHRKMRESAAVLRQQRAKGRGLEAMHARFLQLPWQDYVSVLVQSGAAAEFEKAQPHNPEKAFEDREACWEELLRSEDLPAALSLLKEAG